MSVIEASGTDQASPPATLPSLCVSIVVYWPDMPVLQATFESLAVAIDVARTAGVLGSVEVDLVDNGSEEGDALDTCFRSAFGGLSGVVLQTRRGHGNIGYGRGHNLSLTRTDATYHLVLNPDVLMDADALLAAVRFLEATPGVGLIAPHVRDDDGTQQYLCRAYPSVLVLILRGFAPAPFRRLFRRYMERHELRDRIGESVELDVPLISGCFMLGRRDLLQAVGGFAPQYFMYFEDSELSLAMHGMADVAYVPSVRIVHLGGGAARKGSAHRAMFIRSAVTFFRRNGLRLI